VQPADDLLADVALLLIEPPLAKPGLWEALV
jgi:hypothetical protein